MPERYLIAANGGHVAVMHRTGRVSSALALAPLASGSPQALLEAAEAALQSASIEGGSAEVWLGAAWARLLALDWPTVRLDGNERKALLSHHWSAVLPDPSAWRLMVAGLGSPRLSVALPDALVSGLAAILSARRIKAQSLLPAVCGALASLGIRDGAALLDEGERATLVRCEGGEVRMVLCRRVAAGEDPFEWAKSEVAGSGITRLLGDRANDAPACVAWGALWA